MALTGGSGSSDFFAAETKDPLDLPFHIHVHVDFGTCGASLLNGTPEELLHVEIRRYAAGRPRPHLSGRRNARRRGVCVHVAGSCFR